MVIFIKILLQFTDYNSTIAVLSISRNIKSNNVDNNTENNNQNVVNIQNWNNNLNSYKLDWYFKFKWHLIK